MFINLLTGGNGGGGSTTAGVNSLNGQKGDLKIKTVNNNDLLGEGNIEIQAGVTSVNGQEGAVVIDVPTKVSQLENDANYATQSELPTKTSELTNDSGFINSSEVSNIKVLTQSEYDAIDPKNEKTLYMIKG